WFHLYPHQRIAAGDELHWTGIRQNWNYMCAECHSTGVKKRYDVTTRAFATTFAAPNVGCEACHGPGSLHVASQGRIAFAPLTRANEVERCARCHSRREQFSDDYVHGRPLGDTHRVAVLDDPLYHVDGQIRDEVFEYGSFVQSRMYARGVVCSDCHEPHTATLRAPGSQVCVRCHLPAAYESPRHHFHLVGSKGADCVRCHMPTKTYMVIHKRHDHSIRVPRPDLSVALGVPNACTSCHSERSAKWAAEKVAAWHGRAPHGYQRYAEAFAAAARDDSSATRLLTGVARDSTQPAIARASALQRLAPRLNASFNGAFDVIRASLLDRSALVRRAAIHTLAESDRNVRIRMLTPLLEDTVRAVRMDAARALAEVTTANTGEYIAGELFNADRPESHVNLSLLYASQRRYDEAERELRAALGIDGRFSVALVNLADLYRATHRDLDAERVLRRAIEYDANNAAAHHAFGLYLVRGKRIGEAIPEFARAARLAPDIARYGTVYAIALDAAGRRAESRDALLGVVARHPFDRDALSLLVSRFLERGDTTRAIDYVRRLVALEPSNVPIQQLAGRLSTRRVNKEIAHQ
ncbi:MAG TPA: ammonia-forming cytochrome c nitrite reductase subunit c552, partial [Gemmatimonadaceae bacterium]|nr:ammonia-forming cytochrome c nitrite reductase subunit c552 [Gemmatimonadaceae bacterium]